MIESTKRPIKEVIEVCELMVKDIQKPEIYDLYGEIEKEL